MRRGAVRYDNVPVEPELRIGEEGRALEYVAPELHRERALLALIYLGVGRRSLEETVDHVGRREVSGRRLSERQAVAFPLVDAWAAGEATTLYALRTLARLDAGAEVAAEAALAKSMSVRWALEVHDLAIQFHGGRGYSQELPFERRWRDVRSGDLAHGAREVMRATAVRSIWPRGAGGTPSD
jgi:acyl-CoA dehydrogenase